MKVIDEIECNFPAWAVVAHEYGDYSGLSEEDTKTLHAWEHSFGQSIKAKYSATAKWQVVFTSDTNEFDRHPEFGLSCATVKARIVIMDK